MSWDLLSAANVAMQQGIKSHTQVGTVFSSWPNGKLIKKHAETYLCQAELTRRHNEGLASIASSGSAALLEISGKGEQSYESSAHATISDTLSKAEAAFTIAKQESILKFLMDGNVLRQGLCDASLAFTRSSLDTLLTDRLLREQTSLEDATAWHEEHSAHLGRLSTQVTLLGLAYSTFSGNAARELQ